MPHRGQPETNTAHHPHELILYLKTNGTESKWLIPDAPISPLPIPAPQTPGEVALGFAKTQFQVTSSGPLTLEGLRGRPLPPSDSAHGWRTQHLMQLEVEEFEPPAGWRWSVNPPELGPRW